jgi:Ubiquitin family
MSNSQRRGVVNNHDNNNSITDDDSDEMTEEIELDVRTQQSHERRVVGRGLTNLVTRTVQVGRRGQRRANYDRIDNTAAVISSTSSSGTTDDNVDGVWNDVDNNDDDTTVRSNRNGPARGVSQRLANIARVRLGANNTTRTNIERLGLTRVGSTDMDDDVHEDDNNNSNNARRSVNSSISTGTTTSRDSNGNNPSTSNTVIPTRSIDNPLAINDNDVTSSGSEVDTTNTITVTILDFMHQKFQVTVPVDGTVLDLKRCGYLIHKVPVSRQRLIYLGKLLADDSSLVSSKVISNGITIHLFPKPRVIVVDNNNNNTNGGKSSTDSTSGDSTSVGDSTNDNETNNDDNATNNNAGGARVPTIVMNADEAERRSHILVLGSPDYLEAQNNVKLFSFMLLIISSIEILNILTIALKIPEIQQPQQEGIPTQSANNVDDDITFIPFGPNSNFTINNTNPYYYNTSDPTQEEYAILHNISSNAREEVLSLYTHWSWLSWFDLIISVIGVYVAMLGIRATNDNQLRVAKQYLYGTCTTAFGWLLYNYIITFEADEIIDNGRDRFKQYNFTDVGHGYMSNGGYYNDDALYNQYSNSYYDTNDNNNPDNQSVYMQALQVMLLPAMVWIVCILRAYQFSSLLQEAEIEAENRIREELRLAVDDDDDEDDSIIDNTTSSTTNGTSTSTRQHQPSTSSSNDIESNGQIRRQQQHQQQQFLPSFLINETRQRLSRLQQQQQLRSNTNSLTRYYNSRRGDDTENNTIRETELTVVTTIPSESTPAAATTSSSSSGTTPIQQRTSYYA